MTSAVSSGAYIQLIRAPNPGPMTLDGTNTWVITDADLLIIGGTSLVVYPAAGLVQYFRGDDLVIVNKQPTPQDRAANLVCACDIARAFDF